jgi:hypothetical protein
MQKLTVIDDKVIEEFKAKQDETSILKRVMKFSVDSSNKKIINVSFGVLKEAFFVVKIIISVD